MRLEGIIEEDEIIEEIDIILKPSKLDVYFVEYPLRQKLVGLTKFEKIESVSYKPQQTKFEYNVVIDPKCQNFERYSLGNNYTMSSKLINNRTNYCIGKIENNALLLTPATNCIQMRRSFKDTESKFKAPGAKATSSTGPNGKMDEEEINPDLLKNQKVEEVQEINKQIKRGENLKQIEKKLRTFRFQNDLYELEEFIPLKYNNINSNESKRLLQTLLDPPIRTISAKPLQKSEYLKYLF